MKSPIPIADCHGHLGVHPDFPAYKASPEEMIEVMDLLNIEILAVTSTLACYNDCPRGNAEVCEVLQRFPQRFLGYITVNPNPPGQAFSELERWNSFHHPPLIKLHPDLHNYPIHGPNYHPVWDYANQTGAILLIHTWDSDPNCGPLLLAPLANEFRNTRIIVGHSGVTVRGYEQSFEAAKAAPNLFLDISGSQSHRGILEQAVEQVGAERILFGSDLPFLEPAVPLGRVLAARIRDDEKERILRFNFLELLDNNTYDSNPGL